jgi:PAS domain S-box-containing protein
MLNKRLFRSLLGMNSTLSNLHVLAEAGRGHKHRVGRRVGSLTAIGLAGAVLLWLFNAWLNSPTEPVGSSGTKGILMVGSGAASGVGSWWPWLFGLAALAALSSVILLFNQQEQWRRAHTELRAQLETTATDLQLQRSRSRSELVEIRSALEEHEQLRADLEERVASLMRRNAVLKEELDQRRRAEVSLSIQREELVRSKDVLELHVQARTLEVRKLQRRNELILNAAGEGIVGMAPDGTIAFANPAACGISGWTHEELIGNSAEKIFGSSLRNGQPPHRNGESAETFYRKDGTFFLSEFIYSPIEESGKRVGDVLIFRDVTARRQAELALEEKAQELARSNAELEQFAFVASHDLQEPLRKILAFGDRLKTKCDTANFTDGRDFLERMQNAAARMQTLINDLLTFSRVISRAQPFVPVDLNTVTREVLNDLEVRIERSKARVEVGELPTLDADPTQMRQLIQNLVSNALKFQAPGATPVVQIQARQLGGEDARGHTAFLAKNSSDPSAAAEGFEITVQDNGIGFDEKYLEKMFAVFQRLHGRHEYEGTGIGLAVCRRIVERHGGAITARSKPGEGACFILRLPARQPKNQETKT